MTFYVYRQTSGQILMFSEKLTDEQLEYMEMRDAEFLGMTNVTLGNITSR